MKVDIGDFSDVESALDIKKMISREIHSKPLCMKLIMYGNIIAFFMLNRC